MASIGHIAVGMAAGRVFAKRDASRLARLGALGFWSALSMLPDGDVLGMHYGVRYSAEWGHRGATHSLVFALAVSAAVGCAAAALRVAPLRCAWFALLVVASHGVLDMMTTGGLGCAWLWPFTQRRYFAPFRPIPVARIGLAFVSPHGLRIALTELILFAPVWLFALWPRGTRRTADTTRP